MKTLGLIEGDVSSDFHLLTIEVIVIGVTKSILVPKEYALTSGHVQFGRALSRRKDIASTAENTKKSEVRTGP